MVLIMLQNDLKEEQCSTLQGVTFCFLNNTITTFCMDMNLKHKILLDDPVIFAWR